MRAWVLPVLCLIEVASADTSRLTELLAWKTISFQLGEESPSMPKGGHLKPGKVFAMGVERWKNKLFITTPRFSESVPATLSYIRLDKLNGSKTPDLIPYPSLEANTLDSKAWPPRLVSSWRVRVDECDRLWVVDTGKIHLNGNIAKQEAPPKILIYDLKTDKLQSLYVLKDFNEESLFPSITVDVASDNCGRAFAYLPDPHTNTVLVYNLHANSSHGVTHNYFHFDPLAGDFNYHGYKWQWQLGIYTMALSPVDQDGNRVVFFNAVASTVEFVTNTHRLQDSTLTEVQRINSFMVVGDRGPGGQSCSSFLDPETGVLFYTLMNRHAIGCWNSIKGEDYERRTQGVVAEDEDTLTWPSDVNVDKEGNLWVMTSSMTDMLFGTTNTSIINYRVFTSTVHRAVRGTVCDSF